MIWKPWTFFTVAVAGMSVGPDSKVAIPDHNMVIFRSDGCCIMPDHLGWKEKGEEGATAFSSLFKNNVVNSGK
jgi:hypothetical protein